MKLTIFNTVLATYDTTIAVHALVDDQPWKAAFFGLLAAVLATTVLVDLREMEKRHQLELILAVSQGRQLMIREQRDMARRNA